MRRGWRQSLVLVDLVWTARTSKGHWEYHPRLTTARQTSPLGSRGDRRPGRTRSTGKRQHRSRISARRGRCPAGRCSPRGTKESAAFLVTPSARHPSSPNKERKSQKHKYHQHTELESQAEKPGSGGLSGASFHPGRTNRMAARKTNVSNVSQMNRLTRMPRRTTATAARMLIPGEMRTPNPLVGSR